MKASSTRNREQRSYLPSQQLVIGVVLTAIAWPLAWFGSAPWSQHTFFPLWLGYILIVDGITMRRTGTSLLTRDFRRFAVLFVFSIPLWWLFEFANRFLQNWEYVTPRDYGSLTYVLLASLSFSTVMPAIFVTAELWRSFGMFGGAWRWIRIAPSRPVLLGISLLGLAMFVAGLAFPDVAFSLVWIGVFLFLDPVNALTGGKSITSQIAEGRWDTVVVLFAAGLTCGFFWEMWNFWSMPKWEYDVPHVGWLKVFEMPILGYGGYFPFALEIYAAYHLLHTLIFRCRDDFLRFDSDNRSGIGKPGEYTP